MKLTYSPQKGTPGRCMVAQVWKDGKNAAELEPTEDPAEATELAALFAASPAMLAELRETADWLIERASFLRDLAKLTGVRADRAQWIRDEAARFEGRAAVIRQTILKATQGA